MAEARAAAGAAVPREETQIGYDDAHARTLARAAEMNDGEQTTFDALQRLEQGRFQALGDRLLVRLFPDLVGLRPHGLTIEGKTRKGVPDSYVGSDPSAASIGIEYTTQATDHAKKASSDYTSVRAACPVARRVVLVSNRRLDGIDLSELRDQADADGVTLRIVDGKDIAVALAGDHQDLRHSYLGIEIDHHSLTSLIAALGGSMLHSIPASVQAVVACGLARRPLATERVVTAIHGRAPGMRLVVAPSGGGKTTWSAGVALGLAESLPTVWISARSLRLAVPDPIGLSIIQAAYGTSDPARAAELRLLLRRHDAVLSVWLDALDEVNDFEALGLAIREFMTSALGTRTQLALTYREETRRSLERVLQQIQYAGDADRSSRGTGLPITLDALDQAERHHLLESNGATPGEIRRIEKAVPRQYLDSPLFLTLAAKLSKVTTLPPAPRAFRRVAVDWFVDDVIRRSRAAGRELRRDSVEAYLGALAWRIVSGDSDAVPIDDLPELPDGSAKWQGENTFLGWIEQSGLVDNASNRLSMRHPVFAEELAATFLSDRQKGHLGELLRIPKTEKLRRLASRVASSMQEPDAAIRALRCVDLRAALAVASALDRSRLSDETEGLLVSDIERDVVSSRYEYDVRDGVRLFGRFVHPKASKRLTVWFNALEPEQRRTYLFEFADAFLRQQTVGAARVILHHRELRTDWYEPGFHAGMLGCSRELLKALGNEAAALMRETRAAHLDSGAIHFLAIVKDERLLDELAAAVARRPLKECEHRALIHFNTERAMEIYADSVEQYLMLENDGDASRGPSTTYSGQIGPHALQILLTWNSGRTCAGGFQGIFSPAGTMRPSLSGSR